MSNGWPRATNEREPTMDKHTAHTLDLGNNETVTSGVVPDSGGFLALTFTRSKWFKTEAAALRWHARNTGKATR